MTDYITDSDGLPPVEEIAAHLGGGYALPKANSEGITEDDIPDDAGPEPTPWGDLPELIQRRIEMAVALFHTGRPVILLKPGSKEPKAKFGQHHHFGSEDEIRRVLATPVRNGVYPNYGVKGGEVGFAVDCDNGLKHGRQRRGEEHLSEWIEENGAEWPETLIVRSPSGGCHHYLDSPEPVGDRKLPDIEIKGAGYVVGAWCELIEGLCGEKDTPGVYKVEVGSVEDSATRPEWFTAYLSKAKTAAADSDPVVAWNLPQSIEAARAYVLEHGPATQGGHGDDHTLALFLKLGDFGVDYLTAIKLALEPRNELDGESWNGTCAPPWPLDVENVPGVQTLEDKARSAYKSRQNRPGVKSPAFKARQFEQASVLNGGAGPGDDSDIPDDADMPSDTETVAPEFLTLAEWRKKFPPQEYAIPAWWPKRGLSYLLGPQHSGKTRIMVDLAGCVLCWQNWHGLPVDPAIKRVIYAVAEDQDGITAAVAAWEQKTGETFPTDRLMLVPTVPNLLSKASVAAWRDKLRAAIGDRKDSVLLIETLQRATEEAESQSTEHEIAKALKRAETMVEELGLPTLISCHPPKDVKEESALTIMGTSRYQNQAVGIWTLWQEDDGLYLRTKKVRGAPKDSYHRFAMESVSLRGTENNFGEEISTGMVEHLELHRADVIDAEQAAEERADKADRQRAYALMVLTLETYCHTKEGERLADEWLKDGRLNVTRAQLAREAAKQLANSDSYLSHHWKATARTAGIDAFSESTIKRGLEQAFKPTPKRSAIYSYTEGEAKGLRLEVTRKGKKPNAPHHYRITKDPVVVAFSKKGGDENP